jgi:hypothetical protein
MEMVREWDSGGGGEERGRGPGGARGTGRWGAGQAILTGVGRPLGVFSAEGVNAQRVRPRSERVERAESYGAWGAGRERWGCERGLRAGAASGGCCGGVERGEDQQAGGRTFRHGFVECLSQRTRPHANAHGG